MAVHLQQRATEYGPWRNNAETKGGHGRLKSSTCRLDYKWGDYLEAAGHYPDRSAGMRALVNSAVHLRARHVFSALDRLGEDLRWAAALPRSTR